jgi:hypothetical protein
MMRIVALFIFAAILSACSGSDRVEGIIPGWANTPPQPAVPYSARRSHAEGGAVHTAAPATKPTAEPQPDAKKPQPQSVSEE